jgi:hypothetical protein
MAHLYKSDYLFKILSIVAVLAIAGCSDKEEEEFQRLQVQYKSISYSSLEEKSRNLDSLLNRYTALKQPFLGFVSEYKQGERVEVVLNWLDSINSRQSYWEELQQNVWSRLKNVNLNPTTIAEACLSESNMAKEIDLSSLGNETAQRFITTEIEEIKSVLRKKKEALYNEYALREAERFQNDMQSRAISHANGAHSNSKVTGVREVGQPEITQNNGNVVVERQFDVSLEKENFVLLNVGVTGVMRIKSRLDMKFDCSETPQTSLSAATVRDDTTK